MKVAIRSLYGDQVEAGLRTIPGIEPVYAATPEALPAALAGAEAFVMTPYFYDAAAAEAVARTSSMRWIQVAASGVDILQKFPPPAGMAITNSASIWAPMVAEHAVAMLLAAEHQVQAMDAARPKRHWAQLDLRKTIRSLDSCKVVVVGFGEIGRRIAGLLKLFGAEVTAVAQTARRHPDVTAVVTVAELDGLLPTADVVILAAPLTRHTRGVMSAGRLAMLPPTATLVNVGRGPLVDEPALIAALQAGKLRAAALDVFDIEPLPRESPLWDVPGLILSPHVGGQGSRTTGRRLTELVVENLRRFRGGEPLLNQVDLAAMAG